VKVGKSLRVSFANPTSGGKEITRAAKPNFSAEKSSLKIPFSFSAATCYHFTPFFSRKIL